MNLIKDKKLLRHPSLRMAEAKDCLIIWNWRNDEEARRWSFNPNFIPYKEHEHWFNEILNDSASKILIILDENKKEIGQIRFDISNEHDAEVSLNVDAKNRNLGYGSAALEAACKYALKNFNITKVIAHIKEENKTSINAFARAGFINSGMRNFKGQKSVEMKFSIKNDSPS